MTDSIVSMVGLSHALAGLLPIGCELSLYSFQCGESTKEKCTITKQFLVAVQDACIIYAIEIYIYVQESLTTLYVAKVDTTGCHQSTPNSPVSSVTYTFLLHLVRQQQRRVRLTLFARSQPQYIFPCSSQNAGKHILNDQALVKWWMTLFDRLLRECPGGKGYLQIPSNEDPETSRLLPRESDWSVGYPYNEELLAKDEILVLPDDPKARFLDQLAADKELDRTTVKDFWLQLAFRQEMSSGHAVGFVTLECPPMKEDSQARSSISKLVDGKKYKLLYNALLEATYTTRKVTAEATQGWLKLVTSMGYAGTMITVTGTQADEAKISTAREKPSVNTLQPRKKVKLQQTETINVLEPRRRQSIAKD